MRRARSAPGRTAAMPARSATSARSRFHPRKSITTGEGGMLTTARADWDELARSLRDHGADRSDLDRHDSTRRVPAGGLQPARLQLPDDRHPGRSRLCRRWIVRTGSSPSGGAAPRSTTRRWSASTGFARRSTPAGNVHGYQSYCCLFAPEEPTLAAQRAAARAPEPRDGADGGARHRDPPGHACAGAHRLVREPLRARRSRHFPRAVVAERLSLALPLYPEMTDADQALVVTELLGAFEAT